MNEMDAAQLELLGWWLAWAYPILVGIMCCYAVVMAAVFWQFRQPHMLTAMMAMWCGALVYAGLGVIAFSRPFDPLLLVARVPAAALAVSLLAHTFVAGVEEWHRRRGKTA